MAKNNWTKEETIVAFNVYCKIPFKNSSKGNPIIIKYAKILGRSPSALNMKIGNLGRLDPELNQQGIKGLSNGSKLEEVVWNEFNGNWDDLAFESERIIADLQGKKIETKYLAQDFPEGTDKLSLIKTRVNQDFFRSSILSAYNFTCCITGINTPQLLIASHIIPWKKNISRTNPKNGLCLNALHDKAFDKGLLSVSPDFKVKISRFLIESEKNNGTDLFRKFDNLKITLPSKFHPDIYYLDQHYSDFRNNEFN